MPKTESFDRLEVLNRVTEVFWKKGYAGTSMQDIVDVTGLNRSSLYNSFGDKYQLYLAALKHYKGYQQHGMFQCLLNKTPRESLFDFFHNTVKQVQHEKDSKGCFLVNSVAELANQNNEVASFLCSNMHDIIQLFSDILKKGVEQGQFSPDLDVKATALYLFSSLQGIKLTGMLTQSDEDMELLINRILSGL